MHFQHCSDNMSFEVSFIIWSHVNENKKKIVKIQIVKFRPYLYCTTLVETLPRSMHEFLGVNLLCTFRGDVVRLFFLPYGPMSTKKKKSVKHEKCKILKTNKK